MLFFSDVSIFQTWLELDERPSARQAFTVGPWQTLAISIEEALEREGRTEREQNRNTA